MGGFEGMERKEKNVSYFNIKKNKKSVRLEKQVQVTYCIESVSFVSEEKLKLIQHLILPLNRPEFRQQGGTRIGEINHSEGTVLNTHCCQNSFPSRHIGLTLPYNQLVLCSICFQLRLVGWLAPVCCLFSILVCIIHEETYCTGLFLLNSLGSVCGLVEALAQQT